MGSGLALLKKEQQVYKSSASLDGVLRLLLYVDFKVTLPYSNYTNTTRTVACVYIIVQQVVTNDPHLHGTLSSP